MSQYQGEKSARHGRALFCRPEEIAIHETALVPSQLTAYWRGARGRKRTGRGLESGSDCLRCRKGVWSCGGAGAGDKVEG